VTTTLELLEGLDALIDAAQAARRALALSPDDEGFEKAYDALGSHAGDVMRAFENEACDVVERRNEKADREGLYVAHYTLKGRRRYIAEPGKPGTRRLFTASERDAFEWMGLANDAKSFAFTRVGRVDEGGSR
jgi:hypothetical protein